jgi:predicted outer membrane protein
MDAVRTIVLASVLGAALLGTIQTACSQGQGSAAAGAQAPSIELQEFLRLAYSSASLQEQAAQLAAGRETRQEVKDFAVAAAEFRAGLLRRIEAFAGRRGMPLPSARTFEHRVLLENLEPLDHLELSRRYAEMQVEALEQELGIYQAASRSPQRDVASFAEEIIPELQQQRSAAQQMFDAVVRCRQALDQATAPCRQCLFF